METVIICWLLGMLGVSQNKESASVLGSPFSGNGFVYGLRWVYGAYMFI